MRPGNRQMPPGTAMMPCILAFLSLCMQNASCGTGGAANDPNSETITLEAVRQLAAKNEALIDPIRLDYTIEILHRDTSRLPADPRASAGRPVWQTRVSWARRGSKQYLKASHFYGPNEPGSSTERILDDLARTQISRPDRMSAGISQRRLTDEHYALTTQLETRPFQGQYALSEMLVPERVTIHDRTEVVNDRHAYVVDVTREPEYSSCARIWIDREAGVPVRVRRFDRHPTVPEAKANLEVNEITLHRLSNGGWIPVAGIHRFDNSEYSSCERIRVDVNSIRVGNTEVPESLFRIEFPPGAAIHDSRSGLTSIVGHTPKSYEQIVPGDGRFIAGMIVDEGGSPIPGAVAAAIIVTVRQEDGKISSIRSLRRQPCATSDAQGRFAIELEERGEYDLRFSAGDFTYTSLSGVPLGERNLRITLDRGGAVTGRVVRLIDGRKTPMPGMEVQAAVYNLHVLHRDRMQITDAEGRFQFRGLETDQREPRFGKPPETPCNPIPWRINCGRTRTTVQFEEGVREQTVELILRPQPHMARSLVGRPLPGLDELGVDVSPEDTAAEHLLICFLDVNRRPDRHCLSALAGRTRELEEQGVVAIAVQAEEAGPEALAAWLKESRVPFAAGAIRQDILERKYEWSVRALPWLVLTDAQHIVRAEGFAAGELDQKLHGPVTASMDVP